MKELSIFVDESGDFGEYEKHSPYYVVAMVFHEQNKDISKQIEHLDNRLANMKHDIHAIHTEPLVRSEENYYGISANDRRGILFELYYFAIKCDISFEVFVNEKIKYAKELELEAKISKDINSFLTKNEEYIKKFDRVIIYYDNGQKNITRILNSVFATQNIDYEVRKVLPSNYRLFQVADLICTLALIDKKIETKDMTKSETMIFHSKKDFKKDFKKRLWKKKMIGMY